MTEYKTYSEITDKLEVKGVVQEMLKNAKKSFIDNDVKIQYYEFLADKETDEKAQATWRVEAAKCKETRDIFRSTIANLEGFLKTFE